MNIAERIKLVRQARQLGQKYVAEKVGFTSYDRIEQGKMEPKFSQLLTICDVLEIKIWELLAEELIISYKEKTP